MEDVFDLINTHFEKVIRERRESKQPERPLRIMVVDDDAQVRESLDFALKKAEVQTWQADSGEAAIGTIDRMMVEETFRPPVDLVLLDMKMPRMDGVETMRRLKAIVPDVPVIFITGFPKSEQVAEAMNVGGYLGILPKPVDLPGLIDACRRHKIKLKLKP